MLKIGDFSKLSRISIRMLRYYDEMSLLIPESTDNFTSYRYYSEAQLPIANRITSLKQMGFSLSTIIEILKNYTDTNALKQFLTIKKTEIHEQAQKTNRQLLLIENILNRLREDKNIMEHNVVLKTLPERHVASVRKIIPAYEHEGKLWGILMSETAQLNIKDDKSCYTLAIFHDGEYKENDVDVEVQKTVTGKYSNTKNVIFKTEPAMEIASATYKGSYEQINMVNEAVANWVRDNGYDFAGPSFSIYHISPHETKNPEEWVTEVCYRVKKK